MKLSSILATTALLSAATIAPAAAIATPTPGTTNGKGVISASVKVISQFVQTYDTATYVITVANGKVTAKKVSDNTVAAEQTLFNGVYTIVAGEKNDTFVPPTLKKANEIAGKVAALVKVRQAALDKLKSDAKTFIQTYDTTEFVLTIAGDTVTAKKNNATVATLTLGGGKYQVKKGDKNDKYVAPGVDSGDLLNKAAGK